MKTSERLLNASKTIWDAYNEHPFVLGIQNGTLERDKFRYYIMQDFLYLKDYAKTYAVGVAKAKSVETANLFAKYINVMNGELDVHKGYMGKFAVTQEEIDEAFANMDPYFLETLREAAANIESFHRQQVHKNFVVNDKPGIVLGQKYTPIEKAGVYVPGGTAAYPSTVLMDVIPAKVAGVSEIVMTTPAGKDGRVNPVILAAAATAGVTKIFKTGGAQAVAALAYGTQSIPAVDKIVGPGNIYVATAKRKVFGKVGIDMIAGPSEILVLADGGCNPAWVAADLLSQAEHDKLASPVLVTDSPELAKAVQAELEVQIPQLPRAAIARASVDTNGKIILIVVVEYIVVVKTAGVKVNISAGKVSVAGVHQFFNDSDIFVNASRCRLYDIRALDVQLFAIRKECIGVILCDFHDCFVLALCTFDHLVLAGVRIGA